MVKSAGDDECTDAAPVYEYHQEEGTTTASNSNHEVDSGGCKEENKSSSTPSSLIGRDDSLELDEASLLRRLNLSDPKLAEG